MKRKDSFTPLEMNSKNNTLRKRPRRFLSLTGFTMMEILVVVIVVAILATIAFPVFRTTIEKSREKIALTNLKLILAGENLYRLSCDHYYPYTEGATLDDLSEINRELNLDIESKGFSYKIEIDEGDRYKFKIYASDQTGDVYSIDQDGVVEYLK